MGHLRVWITLAAFAWAIPMPVTADLIPMPVTGSFDNARWRLVSPEFQFYNPPVKYWSFICTFGEPCEIEKTLPIIQSDNAPVLSYEDGRSLAFPWNGIFEGYLQYHAPDFVWDESTGQTETLPILVRGVLKVWERDPDTWELVRMVHNIRFGGAGWVTLSGTVGDLTNYSRGDTTAIYAAGEFTGLAVEPVPEPNTTFILPGLALLALGAAKVKEKAANRSKTW